MTTKSERKVKQYQAIRDHGENLLRIFPDAMEKDPITLCKKLRKIEGSASRIALAVCNGALQESPDQDWRDHYRALLARLLKPGAVPIKINGDPRGYALKIDDQYVREHNLKIHTDWGGYGIIAPEIQ